MLNLSCEVISLKNTALISVLVLVSLVAALVAAGCASPLPGNVQIPSIPATPPAATPAQSSCGFTTCHGLDLACGTNAPQVCTMEYRLGDKCRQYARCDSGGGSCTLVTDPEFAACKSCVEQCAAKAGSNGASAFDCEAKC